MGCQSDGDIKNPTSDIFSMIYNEKIEIVVPNILKYIDVKSLYSMILVCKNWNRIFKNCYSWKYYLTLMVEDSLQWKNISNFYKWNKYVYYNTIELPPEYYRETIVKCIETLKKFKNPWFAKLTEPKQKIIYFDDPADEILCFTYDTVYIYVGHKNSSITVWNIRNGKFATEYIDHENSVNEIVANDGYIISGSSDGTLRLWSNCQNNCLDVVNHFDQPVTSISFHSLTIFSYSIEINSIYCWIIENQTFSYIGDIGNIENNILQMIQDRYYLVARSNSEFVRIWRVDTLEESQPLNNQHEVISIAFDSYNIITCDIKYEIRIFCIFPENGCNHFIGFRPGIRSISTNDHVILLGGDDGYIQKIYIEQNNWLDAPAQLIDKEYFKIEGRIKIIEVLQDQIICLTSMNRIQILDIFDIKYKFPEYWKPKYIR